MPISTSAKSQDHIQRKQNTAIRVIHRHDGTQIKIVAERFGGIFYEESFAFHVRRRACGQTSWQLLGDRPAEGWKEMSREDYLAYGRPEIFSFVTYGEILGTIRALLQGN